MSLLDKDDSIYIAGSSGMVGSALTKLFIKKGYNYQNKKLLKTSSKQLDLTDREKVLNWFQDNRPNIVIIAAAKVGGILANQSSPVEFLLENIKIQNNLIESSYKFGAKRLLFLGSSCIYPKHASQPIKEDYLLNGNLEKSNQWYAIAKIAGIKLCEAYRNEYNFDAISLMPTNLYGPKDNYRNKDSHVMASLIRKFYEAKYNNLDEVICWGSGSPLREFLYVDDFADACFKVLKEWDPNQKNSPLDDEDKPINWMNVGSDYEISIKNLAEKISKIIDYKGKIIWDRNMPDGTPRKKLNSKFIKALNWEAKTNLDNGIIKTIRSFEDELKTKTIRF